MLTMLTRRILIGAVLFLTLALSAGATLADEPQSEAEAEPNVKATEESAPAEATSPLATVQRAAGDVLIFAGGSEPSHEAKPKDELFASDRVEVRKKSKVMLEFSGGILLLLKENSVLTLKEPEEKRRAVALRKGDLIANIKQALSPGSSFEVETPNALAIVRGTVYEVEVVSDTEVRLWGYEGEVEVQVEEEMLSLEPHALFKLITGPAQLHRHLTPFLSFI